MDDAQHQILDSSFVNATGSFDYGAINGAQQMAAFKELVETRLGLVA